VITDVIGDGALVRQFEEPEAGNLIEILFFLFHDNSHVRATEPVAGEQLFEVFV